MIKAIDTCIDNWKPRKRYELIDTDNKMPVYKSGVLV